MERATRQVVAEWRASQDPDIAIRWVEALLAGVTVGLAAAEEQADDVDASEPGTAKHAAAVVAGMRATLAGLVEERRGM